jgi:DNA-binding transcriptional LysR family regulator
LTDGSSIGASASRPRPRTTAPAIAREAGVGTVEHGQRPDEKKEDEKDDERGHALKRARAFLLAPVEIVLKSIMEPDRWLGVELRHLAALQAVAEEGSFGRAAQRLGYTQSAVSQQIATLERIVGQRLFERPGGPRAVSLTEAGELVLRHAEAIVARLRAAQADLGALADGQVGSLRLGVYQSVGARILPLLMQRFRAAWPSVDFQLKEAIDEELLGGVERGELDLSFTVSPLPQGPFEGEELLRDPYGLLVPADSPLARRTGRPKLAEIAGLPLISFRNCRGSLQAEAFLRGRGTEPHVVFRSDDNGTVQGLVSAGVGVALVPRLTVDLDDERVTLVELADLPPRVIAIAWHRDRYRSPAARAFVETARELCAELDGAPEAASAAAARSR